MMADESAVIHVIIYIFVSMYPPRAISAHVIMAVIISSTKQDSRNSVDHHTPMGLHGLHMGISGASELHTQLTDMAIKQLKSFPINLLYSLGITGCHAEHMDTLNCKTWQAGGTLPQLHMPTHSTMSRLQLQLMHPAHELHASAAAAVHAPLHSALLMLAHFLSAQAGCVRPPPRV